MDEAYEAKYHSQEEKHWWFESRRDMVLKLLEGVDRSARILELECSGGPLIQALKELGFKNVLGIDISEKAINLCKRKGIQDDFVMDGAKPAFNDEQFEIIIASDVLEHIKNEEIALSEWKRILKTGGKLIVFVPAFDFLWSKHDEANHHHRRYSKSQLIGALKKASFEVERTSYWNFSLFFPTAPVRVSQRFISRNKQAGSDQLIELNPLINKLLVYLVRFENIILKAVILPLGVSVFAIGRKAR